MNEQTRLNRTKLKKAGYKMCTNIFNRAILLLIIMLPLILNADIGSANNSVSVLSPKWESFKHILIQRTAQQSPKMRLNAKEVDSLVAYLNQLTSATPRLVHLQNILPKTTLELLMAVHNRGLTLSEAEKMAVYLADIVGEFKFKHTDAFDENTSHIIGREWHEIDYSGEKISWQKQQLKYKPYGLTHFKSLECLQKFFAVESRLPYFNKTYKPRH